MVVLAVIGALLITRWVLLAPYELYREEKRQRDSLQNNLDPAPDWSMQDAFQHVMIYSKRAVGTNPDDDNFYTDVEGDLRDAARIGQIKVWAREGHTARGGFRNTLMELSPDVWEHYRISLPTCIYDQEESARITDYRTNPWTEYEDTRVTKTQILSRWPGASWWERWRDPQHKRRLAFFQEERLRTQG